METTQATETQNTQPTGSELSPEAAQLDIARKTMIDGLVKSNFQIPQNYKTVEDYVDGLFNAQKGFTQARQELAKYKAQVEAAKNAPAKAPDPSEIATLEDDLVIKPKETPKVPDTAVTDADWERWGEAIEDSNFVIPDAIKIEIKTRMPYITEAAMSNFIAGLKAQNALKFGAAANAVGGADTLKAILKWAADTMTEDKARQTSKDLKGPNGEYVLLGLKAKYDLAMAQQAPKVNQNKPPQPPKVNPVRTAGIEDVPPFSSVFEQSAAIANPLYGADPSYRAQVDKRILATRAKGFPRG